MDIYSGETFKKIKKGKNLEGGIGKKKNWKRKKN